MDDAPRRRSELTGQVIHLTCRSASAATTSPPKSASRSVAIGESNAPPVRAAASILLATAYPFAEVMRAHSSTRAPGPRTCPSCPSACGPRAILTASLATRPKQPHSHPRSRPKPLAPQKHTVRTSRTGQGVAGHGVAPSTERRPSGPRRAASTEWHRRPSGTVDRVGPSGTVDRPDRERRVRVSAAGGRAAAPGGQGREWHRPVPSRGTHAPSPNRSPHQSIPSEPREPGKE